MLKEKEVKRLGEPKIKETEVHARNDGEHDDHDGINGGLALCWPRYVAELAARIPKVVE